jgi:cobaltochelatase CobS
METTTEIRDRLRAQMLNGKHPEPTQTEQPTQAALFEQPATQPQQDPAELLRQLGQFIQAAPAVQPINRDEVAAIVSEMLSKQEPRVIEVRTPDKATKIEGLRHKNFEQVLKLAAAREHVWMTGGPGVGKTHTAEQVAEALGLSFYCMSVCSQTTETRLFGYNDATGRYIETVFYKAYSEGGIFLLDEVDSGNPNVLNALNAALANGVCSFPCGMVKKHEDFICIAAANTIGTGGNIKYVGRNRIDLATLDRFVMFNFELDEVLERKIAGNDEVVDRVQELRKKAAARGMEIVISPRASVSGSKMVAAGFTVAEALNMAIFNKLTAAERESLK